MNFYNKHILTGKELKKYEIFLILELINKKLRINNYNKNICIINEKQSLRTINSVINSLNELNINFVKIFNIHNVKKESYKDLSRVIGTQFNIIFFRGFNNFIFKILSKFSGSKIFSLLSNEFHPIQILGDLNKINNLYFIGNCNSNICNSILLLLTKINKIIIILSPKECWNFILIKLIISKKKIIFTEKIILSKFFFNIYTDVWVSMNQKKQKNSFLNYRLINKIVKILRIKFILHCLPKFKNEEIEDSLFESNFILFKKQLINKNKIVKSLIIIDEKLFFNINFINFFFY